MKRSTIDERLSRALKDHPGPWVIETYEHRCDTLRRRQMYTVYDLHSDICETACPKAAEFVRELRTLLSDALDEIEQLRAQLAREQAEL